MTNPNIEAIRMPEHLALAMNVMQFRMKCREMGCAYDYAHFAFGGSPFPVPDAMQRALRDHSGDGEYLPAVGIEPLRTQISRFWSAHFDCDVDPGRIASVDYDGKAAMDAYLDETPTTRDDERSFAESYAPRSMMGVERLRRFIESM